MSIVSICDKIYNKLTGVSIEELHDRVRGLREALHEQQRQNGVLERLNQEKNRENYRMVGELTVYKEKVDALLVERNQLLHREPEKVVEQVLNMNEAAYNQLVSAVEPPVVSATTTAQQTGYLLGIQRVLQVIRKRYVI